MIKIIITLLVLSGSSQNPLIDFYQKKITLNKNQIKTLSIDNIEKGNRFEKALGQAQLSILHRRDNENVKAWLGYEKAMKYLKEADTSEYILESLILRNKAAIEINFGLFDQAIKNYQLALEPSKKCDQLEAGGYSKYRERELSTRYNIGWTQKKKGDFKAAIRTFHKLGKEASDSSIFKTRAFRELGLLHRRAGLHAEAIGYFEYAYDLPVRNKKMKMWVLHDWAEVYKELGQYREQEKKLLEALKLHPTFTTKMDLGECYILMNNREQALRVLQDAEKDYKKQSLHPENIKVYSLLAEAAPQQIEYHKKRGEEALRYAAQQSEVKDHAKGIAFQKTIEQIQREEEYQRNISVLIKIIALITASIMVGIFIFRATRRRKKRALENKFKKIVSIRS